jgi:hypothetical protein
VSGGAHQMALLHDGLALQASLAAAQEDGGGKYGADERRRRASYLAKCRAALGAGGGARLGRIGMDPLLTGNGKPYVLMRYGGGPLSLHHG